MSHEPVMPGEPVTSRAIERVFRDVHGQAVATLIGLVGDISTAEDAVQDAFVVAARRWPVDGVPANPAGWIVTTARRRAIDAYRRAERGRQIATAEQRIGPAVAVESESIGDDRLRLIFTCCHPSLRREHQVALTLRLLGGLSVPEIARGLLVSEQALVKRLTRAKFKIKSANIPYRVPAHGELAGRLGAVLAVVYLIYNAGADDLDDRESLRIEAQRLARELVELLPDEPESAGLLALILLNESRMPARREQEQLVLLRDQDRTLWDQLLIREGHALVRDCIRRNRPGPYQIQAAIQAVHCDAASFGSVDWHQIVTLYDQLHEVLPSPVVALNRAIARAEIAGQAEALDAFDALATQLAEYGPLHAARAVALRELGRASESADAFARAAELATSEAQRRHLDQQRRALRYE